VMREGTATSIDIREWSETTDIELEWETGEGDARLRGWRGADGVLAIETNAGAVWSEDPTLFVRFADCWDQRTLSPRAEAEA
jgi:hypothetical protein